MRVAVAVLLAVTGVAEARRIAVPTEPPGPAERRRVGDIIYLERCQGGCTITGGTTDSRTMTSMVPQGPTSQFFLGEFTNAMGAVGPAADVEWDALLTCVREVYSPYAVSVTDVKPSPSESYHLAVVAGSPQDIGFPPRTLGVAPLANDCSPLPNAISFTLASAHSGDAFERVRELCWTVTQESAHAFGLDHAFEFLDGSSACNDPMTYRKDCGGQKFFRNQPARCGTDQLEPCRCGQTQNAHAKLVEVFGEGEPITPLPTIEWNPQPATGAELPSELVAIAASVRGIATVELVVNGTVWARVPGTAFGADGQPPAHYTVAVPTDLPDGIVDVALRAHEDLDRFTDTPVVTLQKGEPCTSPATCAAGQQCEAGRCFWAAPTGELGDPCEYPQSCESRVCVDATCTQACDPAGANGVAGLPGCPDGFTCAAAGSLANHCVIEAAGCCSTTNSEPPWFFVGAFALFGILRRRCVARCSSSRS